uniref:Uncharacterized protein LOC111126331 isoform X1 n=1 Tax=Crassostrea virginica TaxID=6565 RepID=A0A8B8DHY0_CRAVI|nr:uncharacterized protein LOC111126331 isoform X1 [Crassostrea virginica]
MSLSANERKVFWQDHKESLNRIRTQLDDENTSLKSPFRLGGKRSHSPLGLYRKPSPSQLPRIESPDNGGRRTKVRGSRYEVVPSLKNRTPEYDSWGEESDDEDDEPEYLMPHPYPYPMYGYQAFNAPSGMHPPPVMYGNPFPVYYPPPPVYRERGKKRGRGKQKVDKLEVHESYPAARKSKKISPVQYSVPYGKYIEPGNSDIRRQDLLKKYKYIYPRESPYAHNQDGGFVDSRYRNEQESLMFFYFKEHPLFAEKFTDWLILDFLDEIIPDTLIETLTTTDNLGTAASYYTTVAVRDEIVDEVVKSLTTEAVRGGLSEMVNAYLETNSDFTGDPLTRFLDKIIEDSIRDSAEEVVRDTIRDLASDHMRVNSATEMLDELVLDHLQDIQRELVDDVILEIVLEEFIEIYVIEPELEEELPEIAKDILEHYDTKIEKKELKEISKKAGDKLMESICLEYLLSLISRQGKVWNESDHANKYLDDVILNLLFGQYTNVVTSRNKTMSNQSFRKLHEKVVSDVALDLLLQQLSSSLDEDLADVDEYERDNDENSIFTVTYLANSQSKK